LRPSIDNANAPNSDIDVHGNVTECNQAANRITGYSKKEVLGKSVVEIYINPEYQGAVGKVFDNPLRDEDTANFEIPLFSKKNVWRFY